MNKIIESLIQINNSYKSTSVYAWIRYMFTFTSAVALLSDWLNYGSVEVGKVLLYNFGTFLVLLAISGICFMSSSIFNLSKHSLALGGGVAVFFFLCKMIGMLGAGVFADMGMGVKELDFFNKITIISLFDTVSLEAGTNTFIWKLLILLVTAIITYLVSVLTFNNKDLPL